jgi:hypothetical protein
MLLGQEIIPGYESRHMRIIYALVMLIPFLHCFAVAATFRHIHSWHRGPRPSRKAQVACYVALAVIWNAAIAYALLFELPSAFGADMSTVLLFQPDVGWVAGASGVFAIVWGVVSTSVGIAMLRQTATRPHVVWRPSH